MLNKLLKLQQDIYNYHNTDEYPYNYAFSPRLSFFPVGNLYALHYHGPGYDDKPLIKATNLEPEEYNFGFCAFLDFLTEQKYADNILSLVFNSSDEGANGVNEWCFERLTQSNVVFPNLIDFQVKLTDLGDHNISAINYIEENGTIAKLVSKMPNLTNLVIPAAPDASFFKIKYNKLQCMTVQAGSDRQNFLEHLSVSDSFPNLFSLDYAELTDAFDDLTIEDYTPVETFKNLFSSTIFSSRNFHFKLRNSILTKEQLEEIQTVNPKVQFLYINSQAGKYVNHMIKR